jgi:uncharacterized protein (TIGR02147 family)
MKIIKTFDMENSLNYRSYLRKALEIRQFKNPSYTIGAFGRLLGIDSSRMTQILTGKIGISVNRAITIAEILNFSEHDKKKFILLVQSEHDRNPKRKAEALKKIAALDDGYNDITDIFHYISDWHCHAIVEMISLNDPLLTDEIMAKKIGISLEILQTAIKKLQKYEQIDILENSNPTRYKVAQHGRRTKQDVPSDAVKILNEQILDKAKFEIRNQDVSNRDYSVSFLKFDKNQMEQIKEKIKNFRRELLQEFELSTENNSVYCMSIQFFELTGKDI